MPLVQITMLQGRTTDQKRKVAKRITDALVEEAGTRREGVVVVFHEVSRESYAPGGELLIDKAPPK
jgi:4-oxalocrotonate tautomerase